jgi:hypothetical protein
MSGDKLLIKGSYEVTTFTSGVSFPTKFLKDSITDVQTAMFVAKVYGLSPQDTSTLLHQTCPGPVVQALTNESLAHSMDLQDFLVEEFQDANGDWYYPDLEFFDGVPGTAKPVEAELLPEVWQSMELVIAESIEKVAETIKDTIGHLPGKTGEMVFQALAKMNKQRPTIGQYTAGIQHKPVGNVLVVFDVSGSMSENTVRTIVDDVVGLAYEANASLAIVSNSCTYWEPGGFSTQEVLDAAEYGGTHYETLAPLFDDRDWDIVISIADYDSSYSSMQVLARCQGTIGELFDVSLVNRSTFLAECLSPMAKQVKPLLIAANYLA